MRGCYLVHELFCPWQFDWMGMPLLLGFNVVTYQLESDVARAFDLSQHDLYLPSTLKNSLGRDNRGFLSPITEASWST